MIRLLRCLLIAGAALAMTASAHGQVRPPEETDWARNKAEREDPRPLEIGGLLAKPTIDGQIDPLEWIGATHFVVHEGSNPSGPILGELMLGVFDGRLYTANNWTVNNDPSLLGARNAWRFGTSSQPGPGQVDSFFDVFIEITIPGDTDVWMRQASREEDLQSVPWGVAPPTVTGGAWWTGPGGNWQYELGLGDPFPELPVCWYWDWQQLDPNPGDGQWIPVYDGTIHHTPEPALIQLPALLALGGLALYRRRRRPRT